MTTLPMKLTSLPSNESRSISSTMPEASAVMLPRSPRWRMPEAAFAGPCGASCGFGRARRHAVGAHVHVHAVRARVETHQHHVNRHGPLLPGGGCSNSTMPRAV